MNKKWWMLPVLLLAVAGLLMIGCPTETKEKPTPPGDDLKRVDLGVADTDFNTWGGGINRDDISKSTQLGWATDGFTWDDDSVTPKALNFVAEKKGYKLEDFQKATYLVLEMDGTIGGGLHLIWGGCVGEGDAFDEDATKALSTNPGWNDASVTSDTGQAGASYGSTFEDGKLTIELAKAFQAKNYTGYVSEDATAVRLILAYYSSNLSSLELTAAYLLISEAAPVIIPPPPPPDTGDYTWPDDYEYSGVSVDMGQNETYGYNFIIGDEWAKLEAAADYSYLVVKVDVTNGNNKDSAGWGYGKLGSTDDLVFSYGEVGDDLISTNAFLISSIFEGNEWPNAQVNLWDGIVAVDDVISMEIWSPIE